MDLHILGDTIHTTTLVDAEGKVFILLTKEFIQRIKDLEDGLKFVKQYIEKDTKQL